MTKVIDDEWKTDVKVHQGDYVKKASACGDKWYRFVRAKGKDRRLIVVSNGNGWSNTKSVESSSVTVKELEDAFGMTVNAVARKEDTELRVNDKQDI